MRIGKEPRGYIAGFSGAFLLFAFLRIVTTVPVTPKPNYFYMLAQIGCSLTMMWWMISINRRIVHEETRRWLTAIGGFFLFYFFIQMVRYCLFIESLTVRRYMWYSYYISIIFIPVCTFFVVHSFYLPEEQKINRKLKLLLIPAALLSAGFLTNDLHFLAFDFPQGIELEAECRTLEFIFHLNWAFMLFLFFGAFKRLHSVKKNIRDPRTLYLPFIPVVLGMFYFVAYSIIPEFFKINGLKVLEMAENLGFMLMGFLEISIRTGLIPSNMSYETLFSLSDIPAQVCDADGRIVFETRTASKTLNESIDRRVVSTPVHGGNFFYEIDLSNINRLNDEIDEATAVLESRNDILAHENEIAEEREKSEAAILIYDRIAELVRPQVLEVQELLADGNYSEEEFRARLTRSAVLNAYIKRRSNMGLEASKDGRLPFRELITAAAESAEYIKLTGTEIYVSASGDGICSADDITACYCAFEETAEEIIGKISYAAARFTLSDWIKMRIMLSRKDAPAELDAIIRKYGAAKAEDNGDVIIDFDFGKEGETL